MSASLVVLTDFFAVSNQALAYAAELAVPLRAHLVLLHVLHDGLLAPDEYNSRQTRQGERQTIAALNHLAAEQPVRTEVDISEDFLSDAVKEAVRRHDPLLLVLGRPGSATMPLEVVTSAAMDLLRHAPYPLLVVPTVGWEAKPPRRLLLAVDGQPFRLSQHQGMLRQLLEATGATLDVVHVAADGQPQPAADTILATLHANDMVGHLPTGCLHEVQYPTAVGGVLQEAVRLHADMLVVVARRHCLLGSLFHRSATAQLMQESMLPVLILPAED